MKTPKINSASPELVMDVLQQFRVIYGSMRQYFRLVEERCGLPGSQMWVLQEVGRSPGLGIGELSRRLGVHQSTASLMVDKLVALGMLEKARHSGDHRRVGLQLAAAGAALLERLPGPAEGILPEALSSLAPVVLKTLHINLEELIHNLSGTDRDAAGMPLADQVGGGAEA